MPPPVAGPAEVQRAQAWPRVSRRLLCEGRTVAIEANPLPMPARTKLDELLDKAETPEDILLAWAEQGGNGNHAAISIVKMAKLVQRAKGSFIINKPDLMVDPRLHDMMDTIIGQVGMPRAEKGWHTDCVR